MLKKSHLFVGLILLGVLAVSGCTSITVQPIAANTPVKHVCIEDNPKVIVTDFVSVLHDGFSRHGISTEIFSGTKPEGCEYTLVYTALRSWDFAPYLSKAELRLEQNGSFLASAEYHLKLKGGWSLMKWQGTKTKMDPVIDELLRNL